jgi:hypothetical protein
MARRQRLALSVAVVAQVHIAYNDFREASYQFRLARQITHSDRELSRLAMLERSITQGNLLDTIDVAARQLRSEVQQHQAYVELRRAHGNILHALGLDVIGDDIPLNDVDRLRVAIRDTVAKWETLTEDSGPADEGTIEELVGQVLADARRVETGPVSGLNEARSKPSMAPVAGLPEVIVPAAAPAMTALPQQTTDRKTAQKTTRKTAQISNHVTEPIQGLMPPRPTPETKIRLAARPKSPPIPAAPSITAEALAAELSSLANIRSQALVQTAAAMVVQITAPPLPPQAVTLTRSYTAAAPTNPPAASMPRITPEAVTTEPSPLKTIRSQATVETTAAMVVQITAPPPPPLAVTLTGSIRGASPANLAIPANPGISTKAVAALVPADAARRPLPRRKRRPPRYDTQFGAFKDLAHAQALLASLQHLNLSGDEGGGFRILEKPVPGKQPLFHVRFGSYPGWSTALKACLGFKAQGQNCFVVRHKAPEAKILAQCRTAEACGPPTRLSQSANRPRIAF